MKKLMELLVVCSLLLTLSHLCTSKENKEKNCGSDKDCNLESECCASETNVKFGGSNIDTSITWRCKKRGYNDGDICNALGNQHCPCSKGFICKPFGGSWFFGNGYCTKTA